jgi:hypothetical protein
VLASGGMRTVEALAIRIRDIDFIVRPTKIYIRAGYSKTRRARDIYISNEATQIPREQINWKYKNGKTQAPDDLVFQDYACEKNKEPYPRSLYYDIAEEFSKLLELAGFVERKDSRSKRPRHKITLHSIRQFVKTAISEVASTDFSEWFLGHKKSSYWSVKEAVKSEIYATKCMKYLTFLDYTVLEARGKGAEVELEQSQKEIAALREQTQVLSKQLVDVIEQQRQHADTFDIKFVKLLDIVKTGLGTRNSIRAEIVKMMPRKLTTKELQKIEEYRNLTGVFIDSTDSKGLWNNQV